MYNKIVKPTTNTRMVTPASLISLLNVGNGKSGEICLIKFLCPEILASTAKMQPPMRNATIIHCSISLRCGCEEI